MEINFELLREIAKEITDEATLSGEPYISLENIDEYLGSEVIHFFHIRKLTTKESKILNKEIKNSFLNTVNSILQKFEDKTILDERKKFEKEFLEILRMLAKLNVINSTFLLMNELYYYFNPYDYNYIVLLNLIRILNPEPELFTGSLLLEVMYIKAVKALALSKEKRNEVKDPLEQLYEATEELFISNNNTKPSLEKAKKYIKSKGISFEDYTKVKLIRFLNEMNLEVVLRMILDNEELSNLIISMPPEYILNKCLAKENIDPTFCQLKYLILLAQICKSGRYKASLEAYEFVKQRIKPNDLESLILELLEDEHSSRKKRGSRR